MPIAEVLRQVMYILTSLTGIVGSSLFFREPKIDSIAVALSVSVNKADWTTSVTHDSSSDGTTWDETDETRRR